MNIPRFLCSTAVLFVLPYFAVSQCENDIQVPAVNCLNGIALNLAPNGVLTIMADDLDAGTTDDCTDVANLLFSFSQDVGDQIRSFNCEDKGTIDLELWVTDEAGNQDFCTTFIGLEDAFNACNGGGTTGNFLAGCITNNVGIPVENVNICLFVEPLTEPLLETQVDGCYNLQLPDSEGVNGQIQAKKEDSARNGVTTFDAVLARKHILNLTPFSSPYQYIAADVNGSGSVTTFDLVIMRKVILSIQDTFNNNIPNWHFIPADYEFSDPSNPLADDIPTSIDFGNGVNTIDFIAVKTGDVNGSADLSTGAQVFLPVE